VEHDAKRHQTRWWSIAADISPPDVVAPFSAGASPAANIVVAGVTYDYALSNGNYTLPTLDKNVW